MDIFVKNMLGQEAQLGNTQQPLNLTVQKAQSSEPGEHS
jgi:hypothetical protein